MNRSAPGTLGAAQAQPADPREAARALRRALVDRASAPYRRAGRFAHHFARGKLGMDPLFTDLLRLGALGDAARVLDLGCGQAVLAAWLLAARTHFDDGRWPSGWPAPPRLRELRGLELMPRDVRRAQQALAGMPQVRIEQADICKADFGQADAITIFDVLHYFDAPAQLDVLQRARVALRPGGVLVTRVGDAAAGWRFGLSRRVDQLVTCVRGHGWSTLHCRPAQEWADLLQDLGLDVQIVRTQGGPPFANTMLLARAPAVTAPKPVQEQA